MRSNEPLAYTLGWIPFIHTNIYLDSRPLIPRTETEYWVAQVIEEIKKRKLEEPRILDLCAGSGCIGVAVLQEIPEARVDFVEIDKAHHPTIEKNLRENKLDLSRARIFGGDLFEHIHNSYDFILTNPPYINPELRDRIQESVLHYEPDRALYGGGDGFGVIKRILTSFNKYLNPDGILYLEHEPEQIGLISNHPLYIESYKDQFELVRFSKFNKLTQ